MLGETISPSVSFCSFTIELYFYNHKGGVKRKKEENSISIEEIILRSFLTNIRNC